MRSRLKKYSPMITPKKICVKISKIIQLIRSASHCGHIQAPVFVALLLEAIISNQKVS
ncbi:hypothetical protein NBRC111894_663 [Sporolactobacillus inulinus]|uniref:Uncharacterized protein n=1 Tax=Sporolactobacillus inulinus TaxID=2078 RepID=A0A4Y1Z7U9_9BACL|nr:hypothetical protein NBRC111894_663 [Sporolactobacillus inulinus]